MDFKSWLISILVSGGIGTAAVLLMPEGGSKRIVCVLSSALIFFAYLSLFGRFAPSFSVASYETYRDEARQAIKQAERELENEIFREIRDGCDERAQKKAQELGLKADIKVEAAYDEDKGYIAESVVVRYQTPPEEDAAAAFKRWLYEEMGIPPKKQKHIFAF